MTDSDEFYQKESMSILKKLEVKADELLSLMGKFGFDFITKIGQTTLKLSTLGDKIDELNKTTIDIKGLLPHLNRIIENQDSLQQEIDLLRTLLQRLSASVPLDALEEGIERNAEMSKQKMTIKDQFQDLTERLGDYKNIQDLKMALDKIQKDLFEATGGHKILYEISQYVKKLTHLSISESLLIDLKEKIQFWMNKL